MEMRKESFFLLYINWTRDVQVSLKYNFNLQVETDRVYGG